jgi:methionyl-tRNA synthetase
MVNQYFGGKLVKGSIATKYDTELIRLVDSLYEKVEANINNLLVPEAIQEVFNVVNRANKYIDETQPWLLAKDETKLDELKTVLYNLIDTLRVVGIILLPFLPDTAKKILNDIGASLPKLFGDTVKTGQSKVGTTIIKGDALFPRVNLQKELLAMDNLAKELEEKKETKPQEEKNPQIEKIAQAKEEISIADFDKIELKVGKIITAQKVEKSKKLLHFTVDTGDKIRSIVSGVAKTYSPEEMIGKQVVVVTNLKAATLGGILSEGMILFADDGDGVATIAPAKVIPTGSTVS